MLNIPLRLLHASRSRSRVSQLFDPSQLPCLLGSVLDSPSRCISHSRSCSAQVLAPILDSHSPLFAANHAAMQVPLQQLNTEVILALQGGGDKAVKRHRSRGKMLARDRIDALLDEGSPFLELSTLAGGHGLYGALNE